MAAQTKEYTVLVVEDESPTLNVLRDKLTHEGLKVLEAKNGQEGLEIALREHPDLILLDIIMPVMDGITMLEHLRKDTWGKTVEVIILTNLNEPKKEEEVQEKAVRDYLVKSDWKLEDVVKKIKEKLGVVA